MLYKVVDLFSGCGGLSLGFKKAGFEIVGAFEYWDKAVETYNANFHDHQAVKFDLSDIRAAVSAIRTISPDIIIGGPPCQDFSVAGKMEEGDRASLTTAFALITTTIRPSCFVMENVMQAKKSFAYAEARNIFKSAGYGLTEVILDASLCGVPQKRKRFICIGALHQQDDFLLNDINSSLSKTPMTLRKYCESDEVKGKYDLNFEYFYCHPRTYQHRGIYSVDEPSPTIRGTAPKMPHTYKKNAQDKCDPDPNIVKNLTETELGLMQTFPVDFQWHGNKNDQHQMIGNAVPVNLAKFVAENLRRFIDEKMGALPIDNIYDSMALSSYKLRSESANFQDKEPECFNFM